MLEDPKYRATFPVTLSAPATAPCSAAYELVPGTAQPDVDYSPASGSLEFGVGEDTKEIVVDVREIYLGDPAAFKLRVTSPQGLTFARAEGDALIPGKSLHDLLHDTFTGVNGSLFGHQPEIGGAWEDRENAGTEIGPKLVNGMADFGRPWTDYPSGYVAPITPVLSGAGTLSLKVKIDSFEIDPAPEADASSVSISMFPWDGPGGNCELAFDLRTQTLRITGVGVATPFDFPYTFPVGTPFEIEMRYELETGWVGVYVDEVWIYSQQGTPDDGSFGGMDTLNLYTHGFTSLLFDELRVQQGGPGTTHEQVVTPVPEGYLADTFYGTGPLSSHSPEFGTGAWEDWNGTSPTLDGAGHLTFTATNAEVFCDGMTGAGIATNGPTRIFTEIMTLPAQGQFTIGVADAPTIGQSLTGAQVELDFDRQIVSLVSASATAEFPFAAGWETMSPLNLSMYLGTGYTSVLVWFGTTYVGSIQLESAVGDMSNFKFFFRAMNTPTLQLDRVILLPATAADMQVPGGPWLSDTFTGTGTIEGHLPEIGVNAWEQLNYTGTNMPQLSGGMLRFDDIAATSKGIAIPASNMSGVYGVVADIGTVGDTGDFTMGVASSPMSGQSYSGSQVRIDFNSVDNGGNDVVKIISTYGASTPVVMPTGWRDLPTKRFEMRITTDATKVGAYLNGTLLVEYDMESPIGAPVGFKLFISTFEAYALTLDRIQIIPDGVPAPEITMLHTRDDFTAADTTLVLGQVPNITENNAAWRDGSVGPDGGFFRQNGTGSAEVVEGTDPGSYSKMAYAFLDLSAGSSFKLEFALRSVAGAVLATTDADGVGFGKVLGIELRCTDSGENVVARLDSYSGGGGVWSAMTHSNIGNSPGHEFTGGLPGAVGAPVKFTIEWGNETLTMKVDDVVVDTMSTDDGAGAPGNPAGPAYLYLEVAKGNYLEYVDVLQTAT